MLENKKFLAPDVEGGNSYGFAEDEVKVSPFNFGLNAGKTFLKKFEWIPNGGKNGAEQEALDIIFEINGTERSYRQFPVTKAFDKNNNEITDPKAPEFKEAFTDFNAKITHILHQFVELDVIKSSFARPIKSFKEFCGIANSILPKDYATQPLDIFLQYGWNIKEGASRTYLEIPNKMKYGKWLCPAQAGTWKEVKLENPQDSDREALYYVNENGVKHPFTKNGWFMNSNFAKMQSNGSSSNDSDNTGTDTAGEQMNNSTSDSTTAAW
jgi:hypothetical protein